MTTRLPHGPDRPDTFAKHPMKTSPTTSPPRRRLGRTHAGRSALHFDRLEPRLALAGGAPSPTSPVLADFLSVATVDPAPGSSLPQAPSGVTVTFDRPIVPFSIGSDFRLDRVAADGSEAPVDPGAGPEETFGLNPSQIVVAPDVPLGAGHYRLYLLGGSGLVGDDGSAVASGTDRLIDDFTVAPPAAGPGPTSAVDLGSPVGSVATVTGNLDPVADPAAVAYYKVELPQGHFWRLGVEVDAGRIGSPLRPALAVYDAQGRPVAAMTASRPDAAGDPYTFLGLGAGTYYVAVTGRTDLPAGAEKAGAFRLQVVADPADAPTAVQSFAVDRADPTSPEPTGFTLQFAGPMDGAAMAGHAQDLIQIVDDAGRSWSAFATSYDASKSALKVVFDQALPAGHYRVELAGQGDLVDLAGKAPVAAGLTPGVLAQFTVPKSTTSASPTDYGSLFWDQLEGGVSTVLHLAPGQDVTYRLVLTTACTYDLQTTFSGSTPTLTATIGGRSAALDPGSAGLPKDHVVLLQPGVVTLDVKGGAHGTTIDWSFLLSSGQYDILLDNGVGQTSPLGLRLLAPSPIDGQAGSPAGSIVGPSPATDATPSGVVAAPGTVPGSSATPGVATPGAAAVPENPGGTYIAAGAGLVGLPQSQDNAIAAVGPVAPGGMTALSSSVAGIPQGLSIGFGPRSRGPGGASSGALGRLPAASDMESGPSETLVTIDAAARATPADDLPPLPEAPAVAVSPEAGHGPGLFDRASALLAGWMPSRGRRPARSVPGSRDDAALADLGRDPLAAGPDGEGPIETADLSSPLGLGVAVVITAHYHRRLGDWLGRFKSRSLARRGAPSPSVPRRPTV